MTEFTPASRVNWRKVKILRKGEELKYWYEFELPEPLANWDVWDYWEIERFMHMKAHLQKGEILFDIGTEQGWNNLIYAQFVGPENMVLIEPTAEFWPNIVQTWRKNYPHRTPKAIFDGLFSDNTTFPDDPRPKGFWASAGLAAQIDRNKYVHLFDNPESIREITVDNFVKRTGIIPNALTMDTEGSELKILHGAREILENFHPKLWVSVHPELSLEHYGTSREDLLRYLELLGYDGEKISDDHEEHWYFYERV